MSVERQPQPVPAQPVEKLLYSVKDTAFALSVSVRTVWDMIAEKEIKPRRLRGRTLIPATEVRRVSRCDVITMRSTA